VVPINFLRLTGLLIASALPAFAQQIPVIERQLSNGFKLLLVERHEEPRIAGGWVVKVGSSNERLGTTGIAHLFEHMMFKGTPTLGTKDAARDLQLIAEQERVRGEMRKEEALMRLSLRRGELDDVTKPENFTPRYKELEAEFKKLIDEQRQLLVKNEFDRVYTTAGASGMNAFTSEDMTGYFITVPANKLELWCWMESERLLRPVFREFYAERDVVYEERRMRVESTPIGKFGEQFTSMFWDAHPYMWPVLGWPSDIPNITKRDADEFYSLYYQPQNITLILVGDFKADDAEAMVRRYFERIPAGTQPPPEVITREPDQVAEKRMYAEAETNPQVDILWKTVGFQHEDSYPLDILQLLLSDRTGRLYKGLVLGSEVATDTYAVQDSKKWAGYFNIGGEAKDGKTPEDVEQAIYTELDKIKAELVPADELQKVKNQFAAFEYRKLTANFPIFLQVLQNEGLGDWREVNQANAKLQAVTAEDVQRVARKYFTREARAVAIYTRKAGSGSAGEDPDLVGLSADQKPVVRRIIESLLAEKDVAKLKQALASMQAQTGNPDPKRQQLQNIIQKKVAARIAELEKP
jgi:predicted Zn-dependent peptidase